MRRDDFRLIVSYLKRFLDPPFFSQQKWYSFCRYVHSVFTLVFEKIMGLDYSMVYWTKSESIHNSVYTKVPKRIISRIFNDVTNIPNLCFIDVGCGKGYAVMLAAQRGFYKSGGVEYSKYLYDICCSNLNKKGIPTSSVYNIDAKDFEFYGDFDIFFFNNPFDETIILPVAKKIYDTHIGRICYLYYLNPEQQRTIAIEKAGFTFIRQLTDKKKEWYFNINVYSNCVSPGKERTIEN